MGAKDRGLSDKARDLGDRLRHARSIVFFTGAGISTESGIADFRSPGGIWSRMKPIQFQDFVRDRESRLEDWRRRFHFQKQFDEATPNEGHRAIARIISSERGLGVITQNIDGLHQRAGVPDDDVVEVHGNGTRAACLNCASPMSLPEAKAIIGETGEPPHCRRCGGLVKSCVISFGQPMPQAKMVRAEDMCMSCDLFVVLGSSLVVQPAATLPLIARNNGAALVIVNRESTPLDAVADLVVHDGIGVTLGTALGD